AVVGLRHQQVVEIHAKLLRIDRIERVFCVHEGRHAAALLRFRDDLESERRFARRLRTEYLDDAASWHAADAKRVIDADGAGGNRVDRLNGALFAQPHDRPFAELLFDLANGQLNGFEPLAVLTIVSLFLGIPLSVSFDGYWRHGCSLSSG